MDKKAETSSNGNYDLHVLERVSKHYEDVVRESQKAHDFLRRNGLLNGELLQRYRIGFCDGSLVKDPVVRYELVRLGILKKRGKEELQNFVTVAVTGEGDAIRGLYARYLYHDTDLFLPEGTNAIFNGTFAKDKDVLYVAGNVIDALSLINAGFHEAVALCGEGMSQDDIGVFEGVNLKKIYFFMDEQKAQKILEPISVNGTECFTVSLPDKAVGVPRFVTSGGDVSELLKKAKKIEIAYQEPKGNKIPFKVIKEDQLIYFIRGELSYRIKGLNVRRVGSLKATIKIQNNESYHLDTFDLYSSRARTGFVRQVRKVMRLEEGRTNLDLKEIVEKLEEIQLEMLGSDTPDEREIMSEAERKEALQYLKSPELAQNIIKDAKDCAYVGEEKNLLLGYLVSLSRKLKQPLALIIVSQSGAGKTELQDRALAFTPPEDYLKLTRLTDQSLFYQGQQSLAHKLIAVEEEQGASGAGYSIRNLLSANHLTSMTTIRDESTGKLKAISHRVQGPISMMITTTNPEINYETYNRFLVVSVDESHEQTKKILAIQRKLETFEGMMAGKHHEKIRRLHQNVQRLIEPLEVVNPYAEKLRFLDSLLRARREQKNYHSLIKVVALLRQHQKEIKTGKNGHDNFKYIEVDKTDIGIANDLAHEFLLKGLDELSPQGRRLIQITKEMIKEIARVQECAEEDAVFSRREIRQYSGWSDYQIRRQLKELVELEYLYPVSGRNGKKFLYKLVWDGGNWTQKDLGLVGAETL